MILFMVQYQIRDASALSLSMISCEHGTGVLSCVQCVSDWKLHNHELNLHVAVN